MEENIPLYLVPYFVKIKIFDRLQKKYKQSILVIVNFLKLGSEKLLKGLGPLWTNFPPW